MDGRQAGMVAIGGTIGAGVFLGVGSGLQLAGPGMVLLFAAAALLAWGVTKALGETVVVACGATTFVGATSRLLGPGIARLQAWGYWSAAVLACATQLGAAAGLLDAWLGSASWMGATLLLVCFTVLNRGPARIVAEVESWLALVKVATLVSVLMAGLAAALLLGPSLPGQVMSLQLLPMGTSGLLAALPLALFAFGNAEMVGITSADLKNPARTLAPTIRRVMIVLAMLYMGTAAAFLILQAPDGAPITEDPFLAVLNRHGIPGAAEIMRVVLLSVFISSCNACLYGAAAILRMPLTTIRPDETVGRSPARRAYVVFGTATAVALVLSIGSFLSQPARANVLAAAALFGLVNWAVILLGHIRLRRTAGGVALVSLFTLLGVTGAFLAVALQREFRLAAACTATCIVLVVIVEEVTRRIRREAPGRVRAPSRARYP